jgi:hypothetical protein
MKFKDIRTIDHLLMEYGMKPGASTPTSQQSMGSSAKANASTKSPTTSKTAAKPDLGSPTTTPGLEVPSADSETPKFINAKAGELDVDMEYFDKDGKSKGVVKSPIGKGSKPEAVVVQDPASKQYTVIDDPDEEVFVPNPEFKEGKLDKLSKSSTSNFHFKKNKLQKRIKKLTRKIKVAEQGEPIFEINFNNKEVAQGALNARIACGFEAETTWPDLSSMDADGDDWLYGKSWSEVEDLVYDQEGSMSVERIETEYKEWLMEDIVYEYESDVTSELVAERKEDEGYIDDYVSNRLDMDEVEDYKSEKLERLEIDGETDELEEYSEWDMDAWAREFVEMEKEGDFVEWLEEEIRDNGEAWDEAWNRASEAYDIDDWCRRVHGNNWYEALHSIDVYLHPEEGGGMDAVASEIEYWASNNSKTNDVRPGSYHSGKGIDNTYWRVEDDTSIEGDGAKAEIISPVYDSPAEMMKEIQSLFQFFNSRSVETNSTTGMHITMSFPGEKQEPNNLKIALLLGDQYVLKQFNREFNSYTRSQMKTLKDYVSNLKNNYKDEKSLKALEEIISAGLSPGKFSSINFKDAKNSSGNSLIEFRIAGGDDYHQQEEKIMKAIIRYAAVMQAGFDDNAYRKDYIKALFKLVNNTGSSISTDAQKKAQQMVDPESINGKVLGVFQALASEKHYTDSIEALSNAYSYLLKTQQQKNSSPQQELQFEDENSDEPIDWRRTHITAQKYFVRAFAMLASDLASGANRSPVKATHVASLRRAVKSFGLSTKQLWSELQQSEFYKNFPGQVHSKSEKFASAVNGLLKKQDAKGVEAAYTITVPKDHRLMLPDQLHKALFRSIFADEQEVDPNATVSKDDFLIMPMDKWQSVRDARRDIENNNFKLERDQAVIDSYTKEIKTETDPVNKQEIYKSLKRLTDIKAQREEANAQSQNVVDSFTKTYGFAPASVQHGSEPIGSGYSLVQNDQIEDIAKRFNIKIDIQESKMTPFDKFDKLPILEQLAILEKIDKNKIDEAIAKKARRDTSKSSPEDEKVELRTGEYLYNVVYRDGTNKKVVAQTRLGAKRKVASADGKYKDPANPTSKELGIQRVEKVSLPNRRPNTAWTKGLPGKKKTVKRSANRKTYKDQDKYGPAKFDAEKAATRKKLADLEFEREMRALNFESTHDFNRAEIINGLMADHFPVCDLKKQMLAYQVMPIPEMLDAFHDLRAQAGDNACARGIVKYFSQALPEEVRSQIKLNEWSSSHVKSILAEAKGLMGRVVGDQFKKGDSTLEFSSVEVYPQDRPQFDDAPERESFVSDIEQQLNAQIEWTNTPNSGSLAFGIATLTDPSNNDKPVYWGRYFKQKRVDMMGAWANNQVPTGWKLQKAGALKLDLGIDPQHLIKNENQHTSVDEIINTVANNSQGHAIQQHLIGALHSIQAQQHPEFEGQIQNLPALRDYFGEIMGPVALMSGMVGGQAEDARQDLMGGAEWSTFGVFWPQAMNYALVDSVFIGPDGTEVGISSKGGKGAPCSAKNIADAIDKAPPELVKAHAYTVKIIKIVQESTAIDGPFRLAELLGVLPKKLELEIMEYVKAGKTDYDGLSKSAKELFNYGTPKQDIPGFNVGYALIALLAKKVAAMINQEPQFSAGAIAFLNQSSIVQLYCKMGKQGNNARVTGWEALYPPNFRGKIRFDGAKNYYSSRIGGKFAFEFKPDA